YATQSTLIRDEILGESTGQPSQTFKLQSTPILPRRENEYILVAPPGGLPQIWQEVSDFADSGPDDLHYTLDSITGEIQFGPLIREPAQIQTMTKFRSRQQSSSSAQTTTDTPLAIERDRMERQYGAVAARGSVIKMVAYRTGGGQKGNVQRGTIRVLKSAVPYVASVTNHFPSRNGTDAESLDDAVIRVPRILRTRDRAVTTEDFEDLAKAAGDGTIARARCLAAYHQDEAGVVRLLLVPQVNTEGIERRRGIPPEWFNLSPQLVDQVITYLDQRRLLGVEVRCNQPEYVGVTVQTEVALEPEYNNPQVQEEILNKLHVALYRFLNPLTGGPEGKGWPFGRQVYSSVIVNLFQTIPGVRYLGTVQLFELRYNGSTWERNLPREPVIDPGPLGLICSWFDLQLRSGHVINLI
ncbi:MAG: putative baseplate assembly protein, partial [Okeania sp. SIO2D1]|nr:putative baseplate assembly protein [Okeania sp. SIO2D1]